MSSYGVPAFIPTQVDSILPEAIDGTLVDMCVDERLRVVAHLSTDDKLVSVNVYLRENNYLLSQEDFDVGHAVTALKVMACGSSPVIVWLRDDGELQYIAWNGNGWTAPSTINNDVDVLDGVSVGSSCYIIWHQADTGELLVGQFIEGRATSANFDFPTPLDTDSHTSVASCALAIGPLNELAVVWSTATFELVTAVYSNRAVLISDGALVVATLPGVAANGLAIACRGLRNSEGHWPYQIFASASDPFLTEDFVHGPDSYIYEIWSTNAATTNFPLFVAATSGIPLCSIDSRAFTVGDEIFCWLYGYNSHTRFMVCGVTNALRVAVCDREESIVRPVVDARYTSLGSVSGDPLATTSGTEFVWARKFDVGPFLHPGNGRLGAINFLPKLSTAHYGRSVYIAGSLVRNWDGHELGDAGFQDYPVIEDVRPDATGTPTIGIHMFRVYAVRYNKQGEQFRSPIVQSDAFEVVSTNAPRLYIRPVVITNHQDVKLEVYMTTALGTTFFLVARVDNDRSTRLITVDVTVDDATLVGGTVDPLGTLVGTELEEFGPRGCEIITAASDRLWCTGGQVPAGVVDFSKLYEQNEGAGFDAIAGYVVADISGGRITSLIGFGDAAVMAFQTNRIFQITGQGPSNIVGDIGFAAPRLTVVDGAINHAGTLALPVGVAYWGVDGPRLMTPAGRVECISEPMIPMTKKMVPTFVKADLARREVVWYSAEGDAVLWNYSEVARTFDAGVMAAGSRWARWNNLPVAGGTPQSIITTDGRVLVQGSTPKDDGRRFEFKVGTGLVRPEQLLQDYVRFRSVGIQGEYVGPHNLIMEIYYNGSPRLGQRFRWEPETNTWLTPATEFSLMTTEEIDALNTRDTSGAYATHHRLKRQTARFVRVVFSDGGEQGFTPWELSFEMAQKPGLARISPGTFTK